MSTTMIDADVDRPVPLSRRSAIRTGGLAALAAVAGLAPTLAIAAPAPIDVPLIDRAEALVLQLESLLIAMNERDRNNLGQLLDTMGQAAGLREDRFADGLEDMHTYMGPGNRVMDQIDRDEAREELERAAAVAAVAALPLVVAETGEEYDEMSAMLLVRAARAVLMVNVRLTDRATAERWARRHLADGELFAVWTVAKAA